MKTIEIKLPTGETAEIQVDESWNDAQISKAVEDVSAQASGTQESPTQAEDSRLQQQSNFANQMRAQGTPIATPGAPVLPGMVMPPVMEELRARDALSSHVSESLGEKQVNPYVSAAAGMVAGYPDLLAGMGMAAKQGIQLVPKVIQNTPGEVAAAGSALKSGLKTFGKRILMGKNTEELMNVRNAQTDLKAAEEARLSALDQMRSSKGEDIGELRNVIDIPQKFHDVSNVDPVKFSNMMKTLNPKTNNLRTLLNLKDRAESVIEGTDLTKRQVAGIRTGIKKLVDRMKEVSGEGEAVAGHYKQYGDIMNAIEDVPNNTNLKRANLIKRARQLQPKATMEKMIRKWAIPSAAGLGGINWAIRKMRG